MAWNIKCTDSGCGQQTSARDTVDLITNHRDSMGWFLCGCGKHGYIKRRFVLQEDGQIWEPYLRGVISLGDNGDTYQPFVFLVSDSKDSEVSAIWFCYYKDLRSSGGRLKLGHGPGGAPILYKANFLTLVSQLVATRSLITAHEVISAVSPRSNTALEPTPTAP